MKKFGRILLSLLIIVSMFSASKVFAEDSYVFADENVVISSEAKHSIFGAGNSVTLNSDIDGITFLAGNVITVNKESEYLFVAGNQVNVNTNVTKDLFIAGNNVVINGDVGRDAYIAASSVIIKGEVKGTLFVGGASVDLSNAKVLGDVKSSCATITLSENTEIVGTLSYETDTIPVGLDKAKVGNVNIYEPKDVVSISKEEIVRSRVISEVTTLFTTLACLVVIFALFPKLFDFITKERTGKDVCNAALKGLTYIFLVPLVAILSMMLIVVIPLSLSVLVLYVIGIYFGVLLATIYVGHLVLTKLFKGKENMFLSILIGGVLVELVTLIPYIDGIASFVIGIIGCGFVVDLFMKLREYSQKK